MVILGQWLTTLITCVLRMAVLPRFLLSVESGVIETPLKLRAQFRIEMYHGVSFLKEHQKSLGIIKN